MNAQINDQLAAPYAGAAIPQASVHDFIAAGLIPTSGQDWIEGLRRYEREARERFPQVEFETKHVFHAGTYARTIHVPAGVCFTSVLVKIPTLVIVSGHCLVFTGPEVGTEVRDHAVFAGGAQRKTMYAAYSPVAITMVFATDVKTVEEAEAEFTDEGHELMSRKMANTVLTTGD